MSRTACAYSFAVGLVFLVYAGVDKETFTTTICSRTRVKLAGADLKELGAGIEAK